jgi:1-acyl-sn-glycerol-3-phosphate acyltransferase
MDRLFTPEQLETMSVEEIAKAVEERLYYDEYAWLETRPNYRYRSKKLAKGLENILAICPKCGKYHTIVTKGRQISCEHCGFLTNLDDRYKFDAGFTFDTISAWYHWQKDLIRKSILENPDFCLESKVELRHGDNTGKSLTRHSGYGTCRLDRTGLTYTGTQDGEECNIHFPLKQIYRLLFGAGVNFEIYQGNEIFFFVPEEKRSAVDWYMASSLLYDMEFKSK